MNTYKPNPKRDIMINGLPALLGMTEKQTGRPAWALPGGTFTTRKHEAEKLAGQIYKPMGSKR